jgi:nitroreductase
MDAYTCIVSKRDTRTYLDKPIEEEKLRKILQAGRMAGSSKNTQPVRLLLLRDRERLEEVAACANFAQHLPSAAAGIAICLPSTGSDFDAGRSAQNVMLAAWSLGITSCPCSMHNQECATQTLGLPEGWRVCVVLALGYPDPKVSMSLGRKRVEMEELVHEERWRG